MRNLKRFLALALTMLMVIGSFSISAKSFADTAEMTAEQINALDLLSDLSIILGKDNEGNFGGAEEINRKEMAILASRIQTGEKFGASYGENVTPFADVVSDFEAILYAHNMGIVIGYEDGTFRPDDKVIYQDVLTMIVRTLGYNGAAMDAGYPSTYINKARELGLTKGIASTVIPSWTSNVARQDVATLLYNALFAVKADGTTAAKFFGVDTYVVTAMKDYNLTGVTCHDANGTRVVVQPLNADGTINDMYYHLPVAVFEEADVEIRLGASYRIASTDNLANVKAISACPSIELADDADMTAELDANGIVVLTGVDGKPVTYTAVDRYTQVYNTQGTRNADNEIIVYNQRGYNWAHRTDATLAPLPNKNKADSYLTDAMGNLLDNDGYIVAYYMPELHHNGENANVAVGNPYYVYDDATDTYRLATAADLANVGVTQQTNSTVYRVWLNDKAYKNADGVVDSTSSFAITNKDDKYTAVAYDDNYDGKYDRLFFMYHTFGIGNGADGISANSNFNPASSSHNGYTGSQSPVIADTTVAAGELVRFYVDAARDAFNGSWQGYDPFTSSWATVVEKYETTTVSGIVTSVNGTKMTIGGIPYDVATMALHNFKEARPYTKYTVDGKAPKPTDYIGQNVTAVLYEGGIFEIKGNTNTWVIFEDYTGLTTNGYVTALAFSGSSELKNITIASIDGYFFMHKNYNGMTNTSVNNFETFYDRLETGGFYVATKDAYGYYHIDSKAAKNTPVGRDGWYKFVDNNGAVTTSVTFNNGMSSSFALYNVSYGGNWWMNKDADRQRLTATNGPDGASWEFIFFNADQQTFIAGKGFPSDGSTLEFAPWSYVKVGGTTKDANNFINNPYNWDLGDAVYVCGNVIYFSNAIFNGSLNSSSSPDTTSKEMSDIVYVSANSAANYSVDNTVPGLGGAGETIWGFRYVYNKAFSLTTGEDVTVCTDGIYNYKLEQGFYYVKNGIVDRKIIMSEDEDCPIGHGDITCGPTFNVDQLIVKEKNDYDNNYKTGAEHTYNLANYKIYRLNPRDISNDLCVRNANGTYETFNAIVGKNSYHYVNLAAISGHGEWQARNSATTFAAFYAKSTLKADTMIFIAIGQNDGNAFSIASSLRGF